MSTLLDQVIIEPNRQELVEGKTLVDTAQKALDFMRSGTVNGERLVWKVWTVEDLPEFK